MNKPGLTQFKFREGLVRGKACRRKIAATIALFAALMQGCPSLVWAEAALVLEPVQCTLQSNSLNFGQITLQRPALVKGEGEVQVACQNLSQQVQSMEIRLGFPFMGANTAMLQSNRGALHVSFFLDAQRTERWGDGANGAQALKVLVKLEPGERRLIRLPVYAVLENRRDARAGAYVLNAPVQLTTLLR